jgi:hypothetical protein
MSVASLLKDYIEKGAALMAKTLRRRHAPNGLLERTAGKYWISSSSGRRNGQTRQGPGSLKVNFWKGLLFNVLFSESDEE